MPFNPDLFFEKIYSNLADLVASKENPEKKREIVSNFQKNYVKTKDLHLYFKCRHTLFSIKERLVANPTIFGKIENLPFRKAMRRKGCSTTDGIVHAIIFLFIVEARVPSVNIYIQDLKGIFSDSEINRLKEDSLNLFKSLHEFQFLSEFDKFL